LIQFELDVLQSFLHLPLPLSLRGARRFGDTKDGLHNIDACSESIAQLMHSGKTILIEVGFGIRCLPFAQSLRRRGHWRVSIQIIRPFSDFRLFLLQESIIKV
jgi:hypothetical protein